MFEPRPYWYARLPPGPAEERLARENLTPWPEISPDDRIGLGWSLLVSDREEEVWSRARDVPGFRWASVGLLDLETDRALRDDQPPFGVIFYAEDEQGEDEERLEGLRYEDVVLPVVVRHGVFEEHAPQAFHHGRLACWATARQGRRQGWLTARHVADHSATAYVGYVVDRAPECLDAALVDIGTPGRGAPQTLATPAVGGTVDMDMSAYCPATILDVATNLGVRRSSRFPLRFSLNVAGQPGDSGSLIIGTPSGEPMGIYLGSFVLRRTGARAGIGLALSQLNALIDLEVYL